MTRPLASALSAMSQDNPTSTKPNNHRIKMHSTESTTEAAARLLITAVISNPEGWNSPITKLAGVIARDAVAVTTDPKPQALADIAARVAYLAKLLAERACDAAHADARCEADPACAAKLTELADACQFLAVNTNTHRHAVVKAAGNLNALRS